MPEENNTDRNNPIKRKTTGTQLSIEKLVLLLGMAEYTGPPERYGVAAMREKSDKGNMPPVVFPHWLHRAQFTCQVCHSELEFSFYKGENDISHNDIDQGRYCGACHDNGIAFGPDNCKRCHVEIDNGASIKLDALFPSVTAGLPQTEYGDGIAWGEALKQGMINPKKYLDEENYMEPMPLPEHLKKPLRWTTNAPRVYVSFSHTEHMEWLDCSNCHPDIFNIKNTGTVSFDKETFLYGQFCGICHMGVAFPINACNRCHPGVREINNNKNLM
jgi:c(7)-type cytochrome triheme protein